MRRLLMILAAVVAVALVGSSELVAAQTAVSGDIDGDGAADLVVGVPLEDVSGRENAGSVNVIYSNGSRLHTSGNEQIRQVGGSSRGDLFGSAVALGDIDADGYADVIVGSSGTDVAGAVTAGSFSVFPGSENGIDDAAAVTYHQGDGLPDTAEAQDFFGYNVATGDFDDDGHADVVVSAPFEDIGDVVDAGAVMVVPGADEGLDSTRAVYVSQGSGAAGQAEQSDFFGWSLATGHFNDDRYEDLVVSAPGEDVGGVEDAGAVVVLYGSPDGLVPTGSRMLSQAGKVKNAPDTDDLFGFALAASDMNCDGVDDLLVGVPNETLGSGDVVAGLVNVVLGSDDGLRTGQNRRLVEGAAGVAGERDFNQFGAAMAAGDFDGDGCGDVAIGAHTTDIGGTGARLCIEDPGCVRQAGAVVIVYGSERWSQSRVGGTGFFSQRGPLAGSPETNDFFGRTLTALDVNGDGYDELVIGVPREDLRSATEAGKITVLRGRSGGLRSDGDYSISQAGTIKGKPQDGDRFGASLPGSIS